MDQSLANAPQLRNERGAEDSWTQRLRQGDEKAPFYAAFYFSPFLFRLSKTLVFRGLR
jgi:hypothetical protein